MGHAGAIISGSSGTAEAKKQALGRRASRRQSRPRPRSSRQRSPRGLAHGEGLPVWRLGVVVIRFPDVDRAKAFAPSNSASTWITTPRSARESDRSADCPNLTAQSSSARGSSQTCHRAPEGPATGRLDIHATRARNHGRGSGHRHPGHGESPSPHPSRSTTSAPSSSAIRIGTAGRTAISTLG